MNRLKPILSTFLEVESLDENTFHLDAGVLRLQNVSINPKMLEGMGLPIRLVSGVIRELKVEMSWMDMFSSPIKVEVDGIYILCSLCNYISPYERVVDILGQIEDRLKVLFSSASSAATTEDSSQLRQAGVTPFIDLSAWYMRIAEKVLHALQINVTNIHVRLESVGKTR